MRNPLEGLESSQCLEVMVGFGLEENRINGMVEAFIILFLWEAYQFQWLLITRPQILTRRWLMIQHLSNLI